MSTATRSAGGGVQLLQDVAAELAGLPNITRSRTRANIPSGVRASHSRTRSVAADRVSLSGAYR